MAAVRALLAQKVDVNAPDGKGTPALHWAVRVDDVDMAKLLIGAGADAKLANRYGLTPLAIAAGSGNAAMVRLLLDAGADVNAVDPAGETMLMIAARVGVFEAVKVLIERGAVPDAKDAAQQTALMVAVRENHPDVVKLLIEVGADVNAKTRAGQTPGFVLPNSVPGFGHGVGIVRGGLPARGSRAAHPGRADAAALRRARRPPRRRAGCCSTAGADVNQTDANGITPLIMAITNNRIDVARFLLERGADINATGLVRPDARSGRPSRRATWTCDNATFVNGIDRAPLLELIHDAARAGRRPRTSG